MTTVRIVRPRPPISGSRSKHAEQSSILHRIKRCRRQDQEKSKVNPMTGTFLVCCASPTSGATVSASVKTPVRAVRQTRALTPGAE